MRGNPGALGKFQNHPLKRKDGPAPVFQDKFFPSALGPAPLHPLTVTPLNYISATVLPNLTFPFFEGAILSIKMYGVLRLTATKHQQNTPPLPNSKASM